MQCVLPGPTFFFLFIKQEKYFETVETCLPTQLKKKKKGSLHKQGLIQSHCNHWDIH